MLLPAGVHADSRARFDHAAVVADIAHTSLGVVSDEMTRARVRRGVEAGRRDRNRKSFESVPWLVEIGAQLYNLLDWRAIDEDRLDRLIARLGPALADFIRVALQTDAIDLSRAGQASDDHRNIVAPPGNIGDMREQKGLTLRFGQAAKLQAHKRMELRVFVYFPIDSYQQVRAFKSINKLANVLVVGHRSSLFVTQRYPKIRTNMFVIDPKIKRR